MKIEALSIHLDAVINLLFKSAVKSHSPIPKVKFLFSFLLSCACVAVPSTGFSQAFDWQSVVPGDYTVPVVMSSGGNSVTVSALNTPNPIIHVADPAVPLLGSLSASAFNGSVLYGNNRGQLWDFALPLNSVTFLFGDAGGDDDGTVSIAAYDAANNLLGVGTKVYGGSASGNFMTLSFATMDHFQCTSDGAGTSAASSLFFEVSASAAVPEPNVVGMLALGALALLRRRPI
jgi:hypothetical protein